MLIQVIEVYSCVSCSSYMRDDTMQRLRRIGRCTTCFGTSIGLHVYDAENVSTLIEIVWLRRGYTLVVTYGHMPDRPKRSTQSYSKVAMS